MLEGVTAGYEMEGFAFEGKDICWRDTIGAFFWVRRDLFRLFDIEADSEIRARLLLYEQIRPGADIESARPAGHVFQYQTG